MAFTPILNDRYLAYAYNNTYYRNANRENAWGSPVYFVPHNRDIQDPNNNGFGGPHYQQYFNYNNSPNTVGGNCTWWCCGRLRETMGTNIVTANFGGGSPNANRWWAEFNGTKYSDARFAVPGDIICCSTGDGHVMFIEKIENGIIYISHSAYSYRTYWDNYACRVNTYSVSEITSGNSIDIYKGTGNPYYTTVVGVIHTGSDDPPDPPDPPEPPDLTPIICSIFKKKNRKSFTAILKKHSL